MTIFISFIFSFIIRAQQSPSPNLEKQMNFKETSFRPYMINHINQGCPQNSHCSQELGKLSLSWTEYLKKHSQNPKALNQWIQKKGVPFEVWVTEKGLKNPQVMAWESPCAYHNRENKPALYIGVIFIKSLSDLNPFIENKEILVREYAKGHGKTFSLRTTMRQDSPLYLNNESLIYQKKWEGYYYLLEITKKGALKIVTTQPQFQSFHKIDCPPAAVDYYTPKLKDNPLYQDFYCQQAKKSSSGPENIFIFGWSC